MLTTNTFKKIKPETLYNKMKNGEIELLGITYHDKDYPIGVIPEPYIEDVTFEKGNRFEFINRLIVHDNDKPNIIRYNKALESSGLGSVKVDQIDQGVKDPRLLTDMILKGTQVSQVKAIDVENLFIEPEISEATITLAKDIKLKLYKIEEEIIDFKHEVYLLTTLKEYEGQTLLGMLSKKDKLTKVDTEKLLDFLLERRIINKEIPCVFFDDGSITYNLYNTNETGIFIVSDNTSRYSIACGQSFLSFKTNDISYSKVIKEDNRYTFEITLKNNKKLSIFF